MVSEGGMQMHVQTILRATMRIEALSADPVSPALKTGLKKKPASPMFKKPSRAEEEDTEGTREEEENDGEEEDNEKEEEVTEEEKEEEEQ